MPLLLLMYNINYRPSAAATSLREEKLAKAKEWMGSRYVFHPNYSYNPKHRIYKEVK